MVFNVIELVLVILIIVWYCIRFSFFKEYLYSRWFSSFAFLLLRLDYDIQEESFTFGEGLINESSQSNFYSALKLWNMYFTVVWSWEPVSTFPNIKWHGNLVYTIVFNTPLMKFSYFLSIFEFDLSFLHIFFKLSLWFQNLQKNLNFLLKTCDFIFGH